MEYMAFIATVQAVSALIQVWQGERDYKISKQAYDRTYNEAINSVGTRQAAERLSGLIPENVVKTYRKNLELCYEKLDNCVEGKTDDEAYRSCESSLRDCVCAILKSLVRTRGALPSDLLDVWENASCGLTPKLS